MAAEISQPIQSVCLSDEHRMMQIVLSSVMKRRRTIKRKPHLAWGGLCRTEPERQAAIRAELEGLDYAAYLLLMALRTGLRAGRLGL